MTKAQGILDDTCLAEQPDLQLGVRRLSLRATIRMERCIRRQRIGFELRHMRLLRPTDVGHQGFIVKIDNRGGFNPTASPFSPAGIQAFRLREETSLGIRAGQPLGTAATVTLAFRTSAATMTTVGYSDNASILFGN